LDLAYFDPLIFKCKNNASPDDIYTIYDTFKSHISSLPKRGCDGIEPGTISNINSEFWPLVQTYFKAYIKICQFAQIRSTDVVSTAWSDLVAVSADLTSTESTTSEPLHKKFETMVVDRELCHFMLSCCLNARLVDLACTVYQYMESHPHAAPNHDTLLLLFEFCLVHSDDTQFLSYYNSNYTQMEPSPPLAEEHLANLAFYFLSRIEEQRDTLDKRQIRKMTSLVYRYKGTLKEILTKKWKEIMENSDE
jgi:hypothetical protein